MDSRQKHGLKELWWWILAVFVAISILCTSMLAGRRLSTEKSTEICNWNNFLLNDSNGRSDSNKNNPSSKQQQPLVDQVILVIIDALTPRVALGPKFLSQQRQQQQEQHSTSAYFTYIRESIEETVKQQQQQFSPASTSSSRHFPARGFFSVADSPTTTAQRTKAMVTGTIPVLLEAGASFNSFSVEEDNLIEKLKATTVVLGDDTWVRLFPEKEKHWKEAHVYESFDVRDLNTVDDGILEHLNDILAKGTSNAIESHPKHPKFIIAHFLGVDHAGHRYNARDSHLYRKVEQLNKVLRNISSVLRERTKTQENEVTKSSSPKSTLLMVMGDHGMTESGDHGGSTPSETDTFLFSQLFDSARSNRNGDGKNNNNYIDLISAGYEFSKSIRTEHCELSNLCRLVKNEGIEKYCEKADCATFSSSSSSSTTLSPLTAIHQIDLVPTLSAIFGVPIPKQNLGRLVPELLLQVLISTCYGNNKKNTEDDSLEGNRLCRTHQQIDMMIARYLGCNLRQLHSAFCSEFSAHQNPTYRKFCLTEKTSHNASIISDWNDYFSDENIIKKIASFEKTNDDPSSSSTTSASSPFRFSSVTKELDQIAADLSRAAREELTDVDWPAIAVALILAGYVGATSAPFLMFSQSTCQRESIFSLNAVVAKHASYSQLKFSLAENFKPSLLRLLRNWGILIVISVVVDVILVRVWNCSSNVVLFVAIPMMVATLMSIDHRHWGRVFHEIFSKKRNDSASKRISSSPSSIIASRLSFKATSVGAIAFFVVFIWRIAVQESNSCIAREEVMVVTLLVVTLLLCQHMEQLIITTTTTHHRQSGKKSFLVVGQEYFKIIGIGCLVSLSLFLGRKVRDFDSHFIDSQSTAQKLWARYSSSSSTAASSSGIDYFNSNVYHRSQDDFNGNNNRGIKYFIFVTLYEMLVWLVFETPFIHILLISTLIMLFFVGKLVKRANRIEKLHHPNHCPLPNSVTKNVLAAIEQHRWKIFSLVAFLWNVAVSNTTSLPAFILQSLTLFLWSKWFPLNRHEKFLLLQQQYAGAKKMSVDTMKVMKLCNAMDGFVLHLFGWIFFFSSGFHCMLSTIDWNVAFVGVSSVNLVAGGLLVFAHTLRSFGVVICFAIFVDGIQRGSRHQNHGLEKESRNHEDEEGKANHDRHEKIIINNNHNNNHSFIESDANILTSPAHVIIGVFPTLAFFNASLMTTMIHSMIRHKGHLMVWEVFFPRFAFEVGVFLLTIVGMLIKQFFCGVR